MERIPRFGQQSLYSVRRRVGMWVRRWWLNRFVRSKHVRLVHLNGVPFKRVTLPDAWVAERIARNLTALRDSELFPRLVAVTDHELLLEYVEGEIPSGPMDVPLVDQLAQFFAALYSIDSRRVARDDAPFVGDLQRDLSFLRDVGVIGDPVWQDLHTAAESTAPSEFWVGYDFLDPLPRNFVVTPAGRLVAIDVEEIESDQLLGSGVVKAIIRSVGPHRGRLLDALKRQSPLDLTPALPFTELHFLTGWTKRAFLKGRAKLVDPTRFEPYRAPR
jgi:hypothetical protein